MALEIRVSDCKYIDLSQKPRKLRRSPQRLFESFCAHKPPWFCQPLACRFQNNLLPTRARTHHNLLCHPANCIADPHVSYSGSFSKQPRNSLRTHALMQRNGRKKQCKKLHTATCMQPFLMTQWVRIRV